MTATAQQTILLAPSRRARFARDIGRICGASNVRILALPAAGDVLTSVDLSPSKRTITNTASTATRATPLGGGLLVTYNGSDQNASVLDAADLSFGNATADSAFSIVALANITDTANNRHVAAKYDVTATLREWRLYVGTTDLLTFEIYDESVDKNPMVASNAAITQGANCLFGATYSAATGGDTAASDMVLYENGAVKASTPTQSVGYIAMENTAANVGIGARLNTLTGAGFIQGSLGFVLVCATALTAGQHLAIKQAVNAFYGLAL